MIRLNIGCGPSFFPDWINTDLVDMSAYLDMLRRVPPTPEWPDHQRLTSAYVQAGRVSFAVQDFRKGIPYKDGTVEAIYFGQVIEHLHAIYEAPAFLKECFRSLRPGGCIRITTPDLDLMLSAYMDNRMGDFASEQPSFYSSVTEDSKLSFLMFGASGSGCTRENFEGHFHCYGRRGMKALLESVGFSGVTFGPKGPVFSECVDYGMSHSMGVEAVKPVA
jgi:predicted SAM-dependent methyltransferase